jgi:hypothetical protein
MVGKFLSIVTYVRDAHNLRGPQWRHTVSIFARVFRGCYIGGMVACQTEA